MEYTLLRGKGILTDRIVTASEVIPIGFKNAPNGAYAVLEGGERYRAPIENERTVFRNIPPGVYRVGVFLPDGSAVTPVWICDGLRVENGEGGKLICMPDGTKIPDEVSALRVAVSALQSEIEETKERITSIANRIETIIEGYDI